jgi:hypothetical protein
MKEQKQEEEAKQMLEVGGQTCCICQDYYMT